jgi:OOP family OmpA-OmpF porin
MIKNYLKTTLLSACALATASTTWAQAPGTHSLEASFGLREYLGDMGSSLFFARKPIYQGGGLTFAYYLSPSIDATASLTMGDVGFTQDIRNFVQMNDILYRSFRANTTDFTIGARYKLNNGLLLSEDSRFAPYVYGGVGLYYVHSTIRWGEYPYTAAQHWDDSIGGYKEVKNTITDLGAAFQGGLGFKFFINDALALQWSYTMTYTWNDRWDGANRADPNPTQDLVHGLWRTNDMWGYHSIGVSYAIGESMGGGPRKLRDSDEDGVPNKYDKCKKTPEKYRRFVDSLGCPADTDNDGILDADDDCMELAGLPEFKGCPDTDNDSIPDKLDACPTEKGLIKFNGCPDSDGDGVADKDDRCPAVAGPVALKGCPDTDGDGVADIDDKCVDKPGTIESEGCPDSDGDGVFDNVDRCVDKPGTAETKGCPVIEETVIAAIKKSADGIYFDNGKATLKSASFRNLDKLVDILNEYPEAFVEIQGHTDNVGGADANKKLSQERADAVAEYLKGKGFDANRLKSVGYGQEMPIANNSTRSGRSKNRRVEFKLTY